MISVPRANDHLTPSLVVDGVDRGDAVAGGQHPVVGRRRTAALDVAEQHDPGLQPGARFDGVGDRVGDAAEAHVAEAVVDLLAGRHRVRSRLGTLGDDDDRRVPAALVTTVQQLADVRRCRTAPRGSGSPSLPRRCPRRWRSSRCGGPSPRRSSPGRGSPPWCAGDRWRRWRSARRCVNPNVMSVPTMSLSIVLGTPTIGRPRSWCSLQATVNEPLPPITTRPSMPMLRETSPRPAPGPSASSYGLPRRVPSSVPPLGSMPRSERHVERHRPALTHAVPRVEKADQLVAVVQLALADDRPDDRVEARDNHLHLSKCRRARVHTLGHGDRKEEISLGLGR